LIVIGKIDGGYQVEATPPHVRSAWKTAQPLSIKEIIAKLQELGAHQTDVGDAFYQADPNWISN
jgi:hypothetical protein